MMDIEETMGKEDNGTKSDFSCCHAFEVLLRSGDINFFVRCYQFKGSQQYFYYCPFCGKRL